MFSTEKNLREQLFLGEIYKLFCNFYSMNIKEMQNIVDEWIKKNTKGYWQPNNIMLRLMEEVGELAKEINHKFGEKSQKISDKNKEIGDEIADVFYTIITLANSLNLDLEKIFQAAMKKYEIRDKNRHK
jgi:NTP pyrophosphatase (non-canonical NTP hydrolase)